MGSLEEDFKKVYSDAQKIADEGNLTGDPKIDFLIEYIYDTLMSKGYTEEEIDLMF